MQLAVEARSAELVKLLLESGADVKVVNNDKTQSLVTASLKGSIEIVKLLVKAGADVNLKSSVSYAAQIRYS